MSKTAKKLPETPYTSTEGLEVGRRLRLGQDTIVSNYTDDIGTRNRLATSGWKGDVSEVTVLQDATIPRHTQCIVLEVMSSRTLDVVTVWREPMVRGVKGRLVALCTVLCCKDLILSRSEPRMAGEGLKGAAPSATTAALPSDVDAGLDALRRLIGGGTAAVDSDEVQRIVEAQLDSFRDEMAPVLDILSRMKTDPKVRGAVAVAAASSANPIVAMLSEFYTAGVECPAIVCLAAPPSIGKTFAYRQLGAGYDLYLEHGCTADIDEISTLLGSPAPVEGRGFVMFDGVLTQAVRAASKGKTVLLLLDEVYRFGDKVAEWFLTFLTGVETPSGRKYRLRTRHVMPDGTLEVIECDAANLHIGAAANLGARSPNEAFWDRWHHHRLAFDPASVKATALTFAMHYGISDAEVLADRFTAAVVASRAAVADGSLKYSLSFRALKNAAERAVRTGTLTADHICSLIASNVADRCAPWGVESGETDPMSLTAVNVVKLALGAY